APAESYRGPPGRVRASARGRARLPSPRRARLGRGAPADDRNHPRPHAPARDHEDPAPRGDASPRAPPEGDHGSAGSLTGTPKSARTTSVSAARTTAPSARTATARAFLNASPATASGVGSPPSVSSISLGTTSNSGQIWRRSSRLRGDADASTTLTRGVAPDR